MDHPVLACRAALQMQAALPEISAKWQARTGCSIRLGIGLNLGSALVGNTGSDYKFKYGPLGYSVNLASRVEGATKHFGVSILIARSVRDRIGNAFAARRIFRVRVVGIDDPVELYELHGEVADESWRQLRDGYERALSMFENCRWNEAYQQINALLSEDHEDGPSLVLAERINECLKSTPPAFDPVLDLDSK